MSILNNTFNSFANFQENQIDSISSPTDPAMETWGGDKEAAVTAQNLHLIVTTLQSSKYLSIQWEVTSFELIELSNSDSHIKETKGGGENIEKSHEGGGREGIGG